MKLRKQMQSAGTCLFALMALSSCFDDQYDLSDIDTNARFVAKNLTVPLNMQDITLDQVLDLEEGDDIIKTTDAAGNEIYAIQKGGDFKSDPISVDAFTISRPTISPTTETLNNIGTGGTLPFGVSAQYKIEKSDGSKITNDFSTSATTFDEAIKRIDSIGVTTRFVNKITISTAASLLSQMKMEDVIIKYPAGLDLKSLNINGDEIPVDKIADYYSIATGNLDLRTKPLEPDDASGIISITMDVQGIKVLGDPEVKAVYKGQTNPADGSVYTDNSVKYEGTVQVSDGVVNIYNATSIPPSISFRTDVTIDDIVVKTFTGRIEYKVNEFDINPIGLTSLPDFLKQDGTEVKIEAPQIYLSMNNPLAAYNSYVQTGFQVQSKRGDKTSPLYALDNNGRIKTPVPAKATDNTFVLSPEAPAKALEGYGTPTHVPFTDLKSILANMGGVPDSLVAEAVEPMVPEQDIKNFTLGEQLDAVEGKYDFFAPLQFSEGTHIAYVDTLDGWNDEDVDKMTIQRLNLKFYVTTDTPLEVNLTIRPIGLDGKPIPGINSTPTTIPAKAQFYPVEVNLSGNITHLDGIMLYIDVDNRGNDTSLAPTMKIKMDNVRATIDGYYDREL